MRIFLDANVLFSAAKSDGAVRQLLSLLVEFGHDCCADAYVVAEAQRNLARKGLDAVSALNELLAKIRILPLRPPVLRSADVEWLPEKDQPVLAAAINAQCDFLVTGDRTHFGAGYGKQYGGVVIHSPRSLAEVVLVGARGSGGTNP